MSNIVEESQWEGQGAMAMSGIYFGSKIVI